MWGHCAEIASVVLESGASICLDPRAADIRDGLWKKSTDRIPVGALIGLGGEDGDDGSGVHEGGIATPLIAHWPDGGLERGWDHSPYQLTDIVPTVLEAGFPRLQNTFWLGVVAPAGTPADRQVTVVPAPGPAAVAREPRASR